MHTLQVNYKVNIEFDMVGPLEFLLFSVQFRFFDNKFDRFVCVRELDYLLHNTCEY